MKDYYGILGIDKNGTLRDVKTAYRDLAKKYHPDVNKSSDAAREMQCLNEAYSVLGDPIKRAEYDQIREMGVGNTQPVASEKVNVKCTKCGKVDSSLRVSTFSTVWSFLVFSTFKGWSEILCDRCRVIQSLRFNLQVLVFGWWGIPWGVIWSIVFLIKNGLGGHQPLENNAVLLATVGRNLIDAGDYIEAEKALIESLKLKDNEYVQELLKTAKSKAGFKKDIGTFGKIIALRGHPVLYNALLFIIITILGYIAISTLFCERETVSSSNSSLLGNDNAPKKEKIKEVPLSLLEISWLQNIKSKINIWRGERWNLPIQLGDSREHVYQILGDPTDNKDRTVAANHHLQKTIGQKNQDSQIWTDMGLAITFKNNIVSMITVSGEESWLKSKHNGAIYFGITAKDSLANLYSKLGKPFKPNTDDMNTWGGGTDFVWRVGNLSITRDILTEDQQDGGKHYHVGDTWGGISVEELKPILRAEKEKSDDERIKKEQVTLSGKELSSKDIYNRYHDRVFIVTSYDSLGRPSVFGTGFLYRDSLVISNYHVVEDARKITIRALREGSKEIEVSPMLADEKSDFVVLDMLYDFSGERKSGRYPPVQVSDKAQSGDSVTVIGNPKGLSGSVSSGVVSSTRLHDNTVWVQISAPISSGSSGSPVFDSTGHWIGLATLAYVEGQNLNLATPSTPISQKINEEYLKAEDYKKDNSKPIAWQQIPLPIKGSILYNSSYTDITTKIDRAALNQKDLYTILNYIKPLRKFLELYPDPEDQDYILDIIQDIYLQLNMAKEMDQVADERIKNNKTNYKAYKSKGDALYLMNQSESSKIYYSRSINLAKDSIEKEFADAKLDYDNQEYDNESDFLKTTNKKIYDKRLSAIASSNALLASNIAMMYMNINDAANALKWFNITKSWNPLYTDQCNKWISKINSK
jgi:tetratricopeptide (TPR) repeat protein